MVVVAGRDHRLRQQLGDGQLSQGVHGAQIERVSLLSSHVEWAGVRRKERGSENDKEKEKQVWGVWATECAACKPQAARRRRIRFRASTAAALNLPASKISKRPSRPVVLTPKQPQSVVVSHARCV